MDLIERLVIEAVTEARNSGEDVDLIDVWALNLSWPNGYVQSVIDRYVAYDDQGLARPRDDIDWDNVVPLRR